MREKAHLRSSVRQARDAFVADRELQIPARAEAIATFTTGRVVAAYFAVGSEADPTHLVDAALSSGCAIAMPHIINRFEPMRMLSWQPGDMLVPGPFGLLQPSPDAPALHPDIILTPLTAFDHALNRLGQGAGYYDRAFAALPDALRIGVAWSVQQVDRVPTDAWDVPLHAVITEQDWITAP